MDVHAEVMSALSSHELDITILNQPVNAAQRLFVSSLG